MNKMIRFGAAVCAAAAGSVLLPATMADATTAKKDAAAPPPPPTGIIQVCNRSGYMFNVYVDGPSLREDDLAGLSKSGECSAWDPVLVGSYQIGFGLRTTSNAAGEGPVIIQARFRRNHHVYYKVFNSEGVISTFVNRGDNIELDLMIPQG